MVILHQAFCDHCSTIDGESELSRNWCRIIYQPYIIVSCTFTLVPWWETSQWNSTLQGRTCAHPTTSGHCMQHPWNQTRMQLQTMILLTFTPTMNSAKMEPGESVIFQPILQAYPTRHSWIITAHVSLGNLECHWKIFNRQLTRTQQFLRSLDQHPSALTQLLTTLQLELSNIQDIYKSSETTITSAINLLNSNQLQTSTQCKRSLLPFLGATLSWLTGTATTKDICSIKTRINQLIATQTLQCNTLVHIVSILNVSRYATQVNRHSINNLIDSIHTTSQYINNLYNLTTSLAASINFNQMVLHLRAVFANLWDSLHYLYTVSTHTMDYIDATTSGILSPHVLPVADLQKMLQYIADTLPPTLHLPISPEDTLHFYRNLCTHVLIENK